VLVADCEECALSDHLAIVEVVRVLIAPRGKEGDEVGFLAPADLHFEGLKEEAISLRVDDPKEESGDVLLFHLLGLVRLALNPEEVADVETDAQVLGGWWQGLVLRDVVSEDSCS